MDQPVIAVFDANILYTAPLRDFFIRIAQTGLMVGRWSETIHDEWTRNVLKDNPNLSPERLARTRDLMNQAVRDCLVTGYDDLIESVTLPDLDDRHVLAAAMRAGAAVIVTYNLKDFPEENLAPYDIEAQHPDDFLVGLLDEAPGVVLRRRQASAGESSQPAQDGSGTPRNIGKPGTDPICFSAQSVYRPALTASADSWRPNLCH